MNTTPVIAIKSISLNGFSGIKYYTRNLIRGLGKLGIRRKLYTTFKQKCILEDLFEKNSKIDFENTLPHPQMLGKQLEFIVSKYSNRRLIAMSNKEADLLHWPNPEYYHDSLANAAVTVHDLFPYYEEAWAKKAFGKKQAKEQEMNRKIIEKAGLVFVPTQSVIDDIHKFLPHINSDKIIVTHLAASDTYKHIEPDPAILSAYNLKKNDYFMFVSQYNPRKNLAGVLNAFSLLPEEIRSRKKMLIVGDGTTSQRIELEETIYRLGIDKHVIRLSAVPDAILKHLYCGAICLVYASFAEGFGLPVAEAMSCGCPVITSNVSSMPEVAGDACLLVQPHNFDEIADSMREMEGNAALREKLSALGLLRTKVFTWEQTTRLHVEGYLKLLAERK